MTSMGTVYDLERNRALGIDTESLLAKNRKLRAALTAISDLQDRSFAPTKDLIGVAVILARNALKD